MRHSVIVLATMALGLSACGEVQEKAEQSVKQGFVSEFVEPCVREAAPSGIPTETLQKICDCTANELVAQSTIAELAQPDMEKAIPIMKKCAAEAGLDLGAANTAAPQ